MRLYYPGQNFGCSAFYSTNWQVCIFFRQLPRKTNTMFFRISCCTRNILLCQSIWLAVVDQDHFLLSRGLHSAHAKQVSISPCFPILRTRGIPHKSIVSQIKFRDLVEQQRRIKALFKIQYTGRDKNPVISHLIGL